MLMSSCRSSHGFSFFRVPTFFLCIYALAVTSRSTPPPDVPLFLTFDSHVAPASLADGPAQVPWIDQVGR
jgi:hypothetical protein